jgi:hypothetical protein
MKDFRFVGGKTDNLETEGRLDFEKTGAEGVLVIADSNDVGIMCADNLPTRRRRVADDNFVRKVFKAEGGGPSA